MKYISSILVFALIFTLFAGERENLLSRFRKETLAAEKLFQKAATTVELTGSAGALSETAGKQLLEALEYKLRTSSSKEERLKLLADFGRFSGELQKLQETPREGMGSLIGMQIYSEMALLQQQKTAILLLDQEEEKRWKSIADAPLSLSGKKILLQGGKARYDAFMHGRNVTKEILLFPEDVFAYREKIFVLVKSDIPFSGNNDFAEIFLCEYRNKRLSLHAKCKMPYVAGWKIEKGSIVFFDQKGKKESIKLF